MKTYLISYDLGIPESAKDYQILTNRIKKFGNWAKPLKSVWFILSDKTAAEIRDELTPSMDHNDKLLVVEVGGRWATRKISTPVNAWMRENI